MCSLFSIKFFGHLIRNGNMYKVINGFGRVQRKVAIKTVINIDQYIPAPERDQER